MRKGLKRFILIIISILLFVSYLVAAFIFDLPLLVGWEVSYSSPIWSQDGSRIYYIKNIFYWKVTFSSMLGGAIGGSGEYTTKIKSYIMSMRPNGWEKKVIAKFISKTGTDVGIVYEVEKLWLIPNGKEEIVFFLHDHGRNQYDGYIYKINRDGTNLVKLLELGKVIEVPKLFISPDGTKIAYTKERRGGIGGAEDIIGSVFSSWLMDVDGQNNYMICGEESEVEGWTTNGYLIIGAYADSTGNSKLRRYSSKAKNVVYPDDVLDRTLIYDLTSKKFIKNLPNYFSNKETQKELKNSGFVKYDTSISPDGKKQLFYNDHINTISIKDTDGKNEITLLRWWNIR